MTNPPDYSRDEIFKLAMQFATDCGTVALTTRDETELKKLYIQFAKDCQNLITTQVIEGKIDKLQQIVKSANIELMKPKKPFHWGDDTWEAEVPVIPRMLIDDQIQSLKSQAKGKK